MSSSEDNEYREIVNSGLMCKSSLEPQNSDHSSFKKHASSDVSSRYLSSNGIINFNIESFGRTSHKSFDDLSSQSRFSFQDISSDDFTHMSSGKDRRVSSKHKNSGSIFSSDSSMQNVSSDKNMSLSSGKNRRASTENVKSDSIFSSDSSIQNVSSDTNMDQSSGEDRHATSKNGKSDSIFSSDCSIQEVLCSKNMSLSSGRSCFPSSKCVRSDCGSQSQSHGKPVSGMRNFVDNYDWEKDLDDNDIETCTPNNATESKTGVENLTSPMRGWNRVLQIYSPATEIFHSPIKPIEANIKPNVTKDELIFAHVWIVGMSEQFYYDNSLILIHKYHDVPADLNHALIINSRFINTEKVLDSFVDVSFLGRGGFGDVYRVRKENTNEYMAVKFLTKGPSMYSLFIEHTNALLEYLMERNSLIKARSSPFVVQFIKSVKFPDLNGLLLFFEWCLCDLDKYIRLFMDEENFSNVTKDLWNGFMGGIKNLSPVTVSSFSENAFTVTLIYIFEIFCALDFLAKCNIVHQDLKPENIMIATNLHLKIVDFGLAYNTNFITRSTQVHLIKVSDINVVESSNYKPMFGGTPMYQDLELCYRTLRIQNNKLAKQVIDNDDRIKTKISTDDKDADPDFMSDLWACGIIATQLIFGGIHIFKPEDIPNSTKLEMGISRNFPLNVLTLTYTRWKYVRYIERGFINYGGPDNADLMKFLASIFKTRQERAAGFVKQKVVYRYKNKVKLKHIDISKVEKISLFETMGLTSNNVFLYSMPRELEDLLHRPLSPMYQTLVHLLTHIPKSDQYDLIDLKPGIQSNYF